MRELRDIVEAWSSIRRRNGRAVLATIVEVSGSTYRRPGARMLLGDAGETVGLLSGGCLEGDLAERARRVLDSNRAGTVVYDMTGQEDLVWGLGLGCAGTVHVLLEPLPALSRPDPVDVLREVLEQRRPVALATVCASGDAARVAVGAHVSADAGSTGDDELDRAVRRDLAVSDGATAARLQRYETAAGEHRVLLESVRPPLPLLILGGGPDALPLVRLARELGWYVTVVDHRPSYARSENFPEADAVLLSSPEDPLGKVEVDERTVAVVMTHKFLHDVELLRRLLASPLAYLGLLGPGTRTAELWKTLREQGVEPSAGQLARVHAPVGLDVGAEAPEQIALSIVAEILAVVAGREGGFLRDREAPLHERPS